MQEALFFVFFSPAFLVAIATVLVGQLGLFGVIVISCVMVALLLTTKSPPSALITQSVAFKIIAISILPLIFWSIFIWATTSSQAYLTLILKSFVMIIFPLAICTRWSVIHVIALFELAGLSSLGHRIPAGCEQVVLGGPIWLAESIEVFRALPKNCNQHPMLPNKHIDQTIQVFQLVILKIVDVAHYIATSNVFAVMNNKVVPSFVGLPFIGNLHLTSFFCIATLIVLLVAKV